MVYWSFISAAVFSGSGDSLRELERSLELLKPGKPLYRKKDVTNFVFWHSVPWQLDSWELPNNPVMGGLNAAFQAIGTEQTTRLTRKTLDLFRRPLEGLKTLSLSLLPDGCLYVSQNLPANTIQFHLSTSVRLDRLPMDLVKPWLETKNSTFTLRDGKTIRINWELQEVIDQFDLPGRGRLQFVAPIADLNPAFLAALESRIADGIDFTDCMFSMRQAQYHETLSQLMRELPGYVWTSMFASYRKGFDPYARPSDADEGHTVRYPVFEKDLRGGSILQVDVVHRPVGDCFFDIQVANLEDPDKPLKDLKKLLAKVDVPYKIWEGLPLTRWD